MKINNPNPTPAITKDFAITKDLSSVSASIAYTGIGFTPTRLDAIGVVASTLIRSFGSCGSDKVSHSVYQGAVNSAETSSTLCYFTDDLGNAQYCNVASFDVDGFTLSWTLSGSPTGVAKINIAASK